MSQEGDWMCSSCQHHNYKKRESCQRCGGPKYGGGGNEMTSGPYRTVMAGDWYCNVIYCGAHNYANRTSCYQCGESRVDEKIGSSGVPFFDNDGTGLPGWKNGDWICPRLGCGAHNYASRMECYKCTTPRN